MSIAEHIWDCAFLDSKISRFDDLEAFFDGIDNQDENIWPLDMSEIGYRPEYSRAEVVDDKFGFNQILVLDTVFKKAGKSYFVNEEISIDDDRVEINLSSVYRDSPQNSKKDDFVRYLIEKHDRFLRYFAAQKGISPENASIRVEAHSRGNHNSTARGGYVWATYGFDFLDVHELNGARLRFKMFAEQNGVSMDMKDLAYFKHPCHFAAFHCIQKGKIRDLGKEFLLQDTWNGIISAAISPKSEMYRYAKAYHKKSKTMAEKELSWSFLHMMRRYGEPSKIKNMFLELFGAKKQRC